MKLTLRHFEESDAPTVARLVGDREVSKWTSNIPFPYTEQDALEWIRSAAADPVRRPYAVEGAGELMACVSFWPRAEGGVEVGYWVGRDYWGQGVATAALRSLLQREEFPRDQHVYARVMVDNVGSQRVLEKCGFSLEGDGRCSKGGAEIPAKVYARAASGSALQ